jgi:hypothetical protein
MASVLTREDAQRLLGQLERRDPAPLTWLFEQAQVKLTPAAVRELAKRAPVYLSDLKHLTPEVRASALVGRPGGEQEVITGDDQIVSLLQIRAARTKARAHTPATLRDMLPTRHRPLFAKALDQRIAAGRWPAGVGAIRGERSTLLFLLEHVQNAPALASRGRPAQAAPSDGFATTFDRVFGELHEQRRSNLVALDALRARFAGYDRAEFDRELRKLRETGRYVMQSFDGRHGELTQELEEAAICENGRSFVYVARRMS